MKKTNTTPTLVFNAKQLGENRTIEQDGKALPNILHELKVNEINAKTLGAFIGKCIGSIDAIALMVNPTLSFELIDGEQSTTLVGNYKLHLLKAMKGGGEASNKFAIFKANLLGLIANNITDVSTLQNIAAVNMLDGKVHTSTNVTTLQIVANDYAKGVKAIVSDIRRAAKVGTISNTILECKRVTAAIARLEQMPNDKTTNDKLTQLRATLATLQNSIKDKNLLAY